MCEEWEELMEKLEKRGDISSLEMKKYHINTLDLNNIEAEDFESYSSWKCDNDRIIRKLYEIQDDLVVDVVDDYVSEQMHRFEEKIYQDFKNLVKAEQARRNVSN